MKGLESVMVQVVQKKPHLKQLAETITSHNKPQEGDYKNQDGFLVCGTCHGVREEIQFTQNFSEGRRVWVPCPCREDAQREREARLQASKKEKIQVWRAEQEMKVIERVKSLSLMDTKLKNATFQNAQLTTENCKNFEMCKKYAVNFQQMEQEKQGHFLWSQ